jgi:hypothetical protein
VTAAAWQQVLERIETEARQLSPRQVLLTLVSLPFFVLGWVAAKAVTGAWLAVAWAWVALLDGWRVAGGVDGRAKAPL